ncbi:hypothetical protein OG548_14500 [Streptomyces sp. NBC_01356]|uniref:hypothetical protein n=1 Tax=Streptomyces sp. NBC_01356 TaxID=2903836 RepID=UPI002E3322B4|nr:hypothetical protein [Streptomyces sp. NBC_01356]
MAKDLYRRIANGDVIDDEAGGVTIQGLAVEEGAAGLAELRAWGLVVAGPEFPGVYVALAPREVARRRLEWSLVDVAARAREITTIPGIVDDLGPVYEQARWQTPQGSQFLSRPEEVNSLIEAAVKAARTEILAAQPGGPRSREHLDIAAARDIAAVEGGVAMRTLYLESARGDALTREWVAMMSAKGAQFRTLAAPFQRLVCVDRRRVFFENHVPNSAPDNAAWTNEDHAVVAVLAEVFDEAWARADVWHDAPQSTQESITTPFQRSILRLVCTGLDQDAAAKRLGVSRRTVNKEIGDVRAKAGLPPSLAAVAYWFGTSWERNLQEGDTAASGPEDGASAAT